MNNGLIKVEAFYIYDEEKDVMQINVGSNEEPKLSIEVPRIEGNEIIASLCKALTLEYYIVWANERNPSSKEIFEMKKETVKWGKIIPFRKPDSD